VVQVVHLAETAAKVFRLTYLAPQSFMQVAVVVVVIVARPPEMDIMVVVVARVRLLNMLIIHTQVELTLLHKAAVHQMP
jgi:hypothetical protein